jgi:precorrin-4/cobalt-precorrin-4 C11-methyltransferase
MKELEPKVYFVGAGPGDPELITLKGRKLLDGAGVIVWAGSLVNPKLMEGVGAKLHDSAGMNLDETTKVMADAVKAGMPVVRLHTGDISFYSAISEQIERLRGLEISFEIIPGVSSVGAAAAALGQELTIPEVSQSVIHTRMAGRTPVPDMESIESFAEHSTTMAIFLSVSMMDKLTEKLLEGAYTPDTPMAVVERASWPEQRIVRGTIKDIAQKVKDAGIKKTALIFVGEALRASLENTGLESKLYDKDFKHEYRK